MSDMVFTDEVKTALDHNAPVIALESTIISHGLPHPQNIELAMELETIARNMGVTPATIAVMNGQIHIGLEPSQIETLGKGENIRKLSRADIADCIVNGDLGATTVAATMCLARRAGIDVFATGGIGGVHKGASESFDISADLEELACTSMIVICAGAKAILDLPKTFEFLETKGVAVYGYQTDELPAFYSRSSGIKAPLRADDPAYIAKAFQKRQSLQIEGAHLINNPIPPENEIKTSEINPIIKTALDDARAQGIEGKAVTPFLLDRLYRLSDGRTLTSNIALVKNNVRLGAKIALALAQNGFK